MEVLRQSANFQLKQAQILNQNKYFVHLQNSDTEKER
jgi:hypothetical protein